MERLLYEIRSTGCRLQPRVPLQGKVVMEDLLKSRIFDTRDNIRVDRHPLEHYTHIDKRGVRRIDDYEKASGKAIYTMDIDFSAPAVHNALGIWTDDSPLTPAVVLKALGQS